MFKKIIAFALALCSLSGVVFVSGCGIMEGLFGNPNQMFDECTETTGKWIYRDFYTGEATDDYFIFDGTKNVMKFEYYKNGELVRDGIYRVVYRGEEKVDSTPLSIGLEIKGDKKHRDWLYCYVEDFKSDFTQFTVISEEKDIDMSYSGTPRWRYYRMSEMPFEFGTYVKEGSEIKKYRNDAERAAKFHFLNGDYVNADGAVFTFKTTYPAFSNLLFRYEYGGKSVEGMFTIGYKKDKIFLWLEYHAGFLPDAEQKRKYEMESGQDFPPNFNVYGSFGAAREERRFSIDRVEPIKGYGYDPQVCEIRTGEYVCVSQYDVG